MKNYLSTYTTKKHSLLALLASLIIIATLFTLAMISFPKVHAESIQYYYIKTNTTMLIDDGVIKGSISLPKTYYVQKSTDADTVVSEETYKTVIYNGVKGKVKASSLSRKSLSVKAPFYTNNTSLTSLSSSISILHFSLPQPGLTVPVVVIPASTALTFVAHTNDTDYFFVKYGSSIGYVQKDHCTPSDVVITANASAIDPDEQADSANSSLGDKSNPDDKKATNTVRILLICGICILSVLVVFLIFKPVKNKKPPKGDFYDM